MYTKLQWQQIARQQLEDSCAVTVRSAPPRGLPGISFANPRLLLSLLFSSSLPKKVIKNMESAPLMKLCELPKETEAANPVVVD
jgi:hypothetical protein